MKKNVIRGIAVASVALFVTVGVVWAASLHDITARLGGQTGDYFDLNGSLLTDSLKVGSQGVGGVTFFNGTIINNTTDTDNNDQPVTFGDNVRIDGALYRGATAGPGDDMAFKLNDDVRVYGNLTVDPTRTITVTDVTFVGLSTADLSDVASIAMLSEGEVIAEDWDNTANPWAADEIADAVRIVELPLTSLVTDPTGTPVPVDSTTAEPVLTYTANQGLALVYSEDDTVGIGTQFTVPVDYASGGVFKAVVDTSAAIVTDWDLDFSVAISDVLGTPAWDTDMDDETAVNVTDNAGTPAVMTFTPTDQAGLVAGATVLFNLFPASNTGAGEPDLEIYNVWFEYTASQ